MLEAMHIRIWIIVALSWFVIARPMKRYEGLAETYIQVLGSNIVANDTAPIPP